MRNFKFEWSLAKELDGELFYLAREYSIDFEPKSPESISDRVGSAGSTSLLFATLQIELSVETGEVLYPWGLFPNTRWRPGSLETPSFVSGRVRLLSEEALQPGVSWAFPGGESWPSIRDTASGWICIGDPATGPASSAVRYASNCGLVLVGERLTSIWLRPRLNID